MNAVDPVFRELCALALAMIFGASGVIKLRDVEMFHGSVANYRLLPERIEEPFAYLVPLAECLSALGLLMRSTRTVAASSLIVLMMIFTGAIALNLVHGRTNIDCGCFGPALRQELSGWLILRNLFLLVLAAALVIIPDSGRALESLDGATIVFGALTVVVVYASANIVFSNEPKTRALEML